MEMPAIHSCDSDDSDGEIYRPLARRNGRSTSRTLLASKRYTSPDPRSHLRVPGLDSRTGGNSSHERRGLAEQNPPLRKQRKRPDLQRNRRTAASEPHDLIPFDPIELRDSQAADLPPAFDPSELRENWVPDLRGSPGETGEHCTNLNSALGGDASGMDNGSEDSRERPARELPLTFFRRWCRI